MCGGSFLGRLGRAVLMRVRLRGQRYRGSTSPFMPQRETDNADE